jgi:hypothetical protein
MLRGAAVRALEKATAATARWRSRPWIATLTVVTCLPFAMWLLGSGIVWMTPATYRSSVLLHAAADGTSANEILKSAAVMEHATQALARSEATASDPMAAYSLWSSVTVTPNAGPELVKLEARGADAEEARRTVLAVAQAWRQAQHEGGHQAPTLVYVDPLEAAPQRVSDEMRMILGLAGTATLCLLLCIPLLLFAEKRLPVRARRTVAIPAHPPQPALLA